MSKYTPRVTLEEHMKKTQPTRDKAKSYLKGRMPLLKKHSLLTECIDFDAWLEENKDMINDIYREYKSQVEGDAITKEAFGRALYDAQCDERSNEFDLGNKGEEYHEDEEYIASEE